MISQTPRFTADHVHHFEKGSAESTFVLVLGDRVARHDVSGVEVQGRIVYSPNAVERKGEFVESSYHRLRGFSYPRRLMGDKIRMNIIGMKDRDRFWLGGQGENEQKPETADKRKFFDHVHARKALVIG